MRQTKVVIINTSRSRGPRKKDAVLEVAAISIKQNPYRFWQLLGVSCTGQSELGSAARQEPRVDAKSTGYTI